MPNTYKKLKEWINKNPEKWKVMQKKYRDKNKEKINEWTKDWQKKHPEKAKEYKVKWYKKWREKNPYKISPHGTGWNTMRLKTLARDNCVCQNCGEDATEVHHKDGSGSNVFVKEMNNNLDNLITLCHSCHLTADAQLFSDGFSRGHLSDPERDTNILNLVGVISQSDIARTFDLTRQRVSQIIKKKL